MTLHIFAKPFFLLSKQELNSQFPDSNQDPTFLGDEVVGASVSRLKDSAPFYNSHHTDQHDRVGSKRGGESWREPGLVDLVRLA